MTCCLCHVYGTDHPDSSWCRRCRLQEIERSIRARRARERANLPPFLCFLADTMVEAGWSARSVTAAQHALGRPETAVPAVFAHLVEPAA